ncbi:M3 family oligoendopeptidase [Candidatus Pacearchaeota archaeon]|nr:M3 family oligoendopeptidase [Candidatus Pacearchaeota archaeon]
MFLSAMSEKWDLSKLFKNDNDPKIENRKEDVRKAIEKFRVKWASRDDYLNDPKILREALDDFELLMRHHGVEGGIVFYFSLRSSQEQENPNVKAKFSQALEFARKMENEIRFFNLKIGKIPLEVQKKMLTDKGLDRYKHYLERCFSQAKYILSEKEENILSLKADVAYTNWVDMVQQFLSSEEREVFGEDGKKTIKNFSEIDNLLKSNDKKVRDSAANAFNDILLKNINVAEHELNAVLKNKKIDDELRKLPRPDASRHIDDDLDSSVVDTLAEAVASRFESVKRLYALKAKLLKVKSFTYPERNVLYLAGSSEKKYPYPEALSLVRKVFSSLDKEFAEILDNFIKNGQIDAFPGKGKRDGAFCSDDLVTMPTYVLLNHIDSLRDVIVIAHEMGHAVNSELMKKQHSLNFGTLLSTAEVASTFMEDFVVQEVEKEADDEMRLEIMMRRLQDDVSTIFRQIACYRFEQEIHEEFRKKGYLSKEEIGKIFSKHMTSYLGENASGCENWWVYWRHIRTYFYNYSYASGLLISKSLQNEVKKDPKYIEKVKEFLRAGTSASPKEIFLKMGIDISKRDFWFKGLDEFDGNVKEAENLAKRLRKI